ncbi:MAG: MFS transporter [Chloroflexi bacterium]|nr:MFS transporter [Chloroflexota bacterium]MCC6891793.1 MFS transporter [Anaerolineae bacterium]
MRSYITLLRQNPGFARLWYAQVISLFGDWFNIIALSGLVTQYTDKSGLAVSGLLLARVLPPFIVSPFAGVLIDRFDRKRLLIISDVMRTLIGLSLFFATSPERLWIIYAATIVQFMFSALFEPARSALMPGLLPPKDLLKANVLSNVTWSVMLAVGAMIGGVITAVFGITVALIVDCASFALSAFLLTTIRVPVQSIEVNNPDLPRKASKGFTDGLAYARQRPNILIVLLVKAGLSVGSVDTLIIAYGTSLFVIGENGTGSMGILYTFFGLGALLGPALLNRFNNGQVVTMRRLMILSFAWVTVGWILLGAAPTIWLASIALLIRAMGGSATWTYSSTIIQMSTDNAYLGRMFSLDWAAFYLVITISTLLTGQVLETQGNEAAHSVALVIGVLSIIPLIAWAVAVRWVEKHMPIMPVVETEPTPSAESGAVGVQPTAAHQSDFGV